MVRSGNLIGVVVAATTVAVVTSATAQVRDAVYRGTLVCDKLPFSAGKGREAIEVSISGSSVQYTHVVRLRDAAEPVKERGSGTLRVRTSVCRAPGRAAIGNMKPNTAALSYAVMPISKAPKPGRTAE